MHICANIARRCIVDTVFNNRASMGDTIIGPE